MKDLYSRLSALKMILNSYYGSGGIATKVYEESYMIRKKILKIKVRKEKIKRIFNA